MTADYEQMGAWGLARMHDGKRAFDDKHTAKVAARRTSAAFGGPPKHEYRCIVCDSWHVGRKAPKATVRGDFSEVLR